MIIMNIEFDGVGRGKKQKSGGWVEVAQNKGKRIKKHNNSFNRLCILSFIISIFHQTFMGEKEEEPKEKPDFKDVENGPLDESNRQCRDIICCILFLGNIIAMIYVTIYAYIDGNVEYIYRGVSENQVQCGKPGGVAEKYPYLYFKNPISSTDLRFCVKTCPTYSGSTLSNLDCYEGNCAYDHTYNSDGTISVNIATLNNSANVLGYGTTTALERVCLPSSQVLAEGFSSVASSMTSVLQEGEFASLITDIKNNWYWLLAGLGMAIVISLLFMFLLRCLVGCIVWFSVIGVILAFVGAGVIFLYNGGAFKGTAADEYAGFLGMPTLDGSDYYKTYGYISFGIAGVLLILLLCCCNRLRLAVAVCKVAGRFVIRVCHVAFVPIILTIILIGMWACCLLCLIYLLSHAPFAVAKATDVFTSISSYTDGNLFRFYYFFFATLWCGAFISAIGIFVIAACCAMWYYNHGANEDLDSPVTRSFKMAFRFHFGSLAFGAFILAVVQFLQAMVEAFKAQAQSSGADRNVCFETIINCLRCCLACVERIVQFLNKTAYIQIAIRGKNFCMAAKDGFETVWSNGMRYLIVAGVGEIMMFLGKLMIAAGTTALFYVLITFVESIKMNIIEPIYMLLIVFIISYFIAVLFMGIYTIAMDTILACFIIDEMNQQASGGKKALHAPEELYDLMPQE